LGAGFFICVNSSHRTEAMLPARRPLDGQEQWSPVRSGTLRN
jgi:hypothetical protein